jgi:hypothetical protein
MIDYYNANIQKKQNKESCGKLSSMDSRPSPPHPQSEYRQLPEIKSISGALLCRKNKTHYMLAYPTFPGNRVSSGSSTFTTLFGMGRGGTCSSETPTNNGFHCFYDRVRNWNVRQNSDFGADEGARPTDDVGRDELDHREIIKDNLLQDGLDDGEPRQTIHIFSVFTTWYEMVY